MPIETVLYELPRPASSPPRPLLERKPRKALEQPRRVQKAPKTSVKIMPHGCTDPAADARLGTWLREFVWQGPRSPESKRGGWHCTSCGERKPGSTEEW